MLGFRLTKSTNCAKLQYRYQVVIMTELKRPNPYNAKNIKESKDTAKISRRKEQSSTKAVAIPPKPFPGKRVS